MFYDTYPNAGRRVTIEPAAIIRSPAFSAPYPRIINDELIDAGVRQSMEASWKQGEFADRDIQVFRIKGAYVIDENLVLDDSLRVITNIDDSYSPEEIERAIDCIRGKLASKQMVFLGRAVVAKRRAINNYGHYLLYMLPLAFLGKAYFNDVDHVYLSHQVSPPMQDVILRSFRLAGVALDQVHLLPWLEPVHCEEVLFFSGLADHGTYLSPLAVQVVTEIATPIPTGPHRKIFVRRKPGSGAGRLLLNEDEIATRLAAKGFHVIDPGSMCLEEQIFTFKGAKYVVGSLGAGMTNIVFCQPGTKVAVLSSGVFPDTFYWFIAAHRQLDYLDIRGERASFDGPEFWRAGFSIREADIQFLEALGEHTDVGNAQCSPEGAEPPNSDEAGNSVVAL
jgi:capsular polysaccharide biosynthesis protein